ncbi:MAG: VOC family protein [Pseudomonadota bacterium]
MEPALDIVTLGVDDLARSTAFYEAFGLRRRLRDLTGVAFFEAGGVVLGLYPLDALAAEAGAPADRPAFVASSLACNLPSKAAVDAQIARALAVGATVRAPAQDRFWGGYSGYVGDLDGFVWEIAWNPHFVRDAQGRLQLAD